MIFSLLINSSPASATARNALLFARATLDAGHRINRVFFFGDGALHANAFNAPAGQTHCLGEDWSAMAATHQIDLIACVGSALRNGIVDPATAKRLGIDCSNVRAGFEVSGLGQLVDATVTADRVISFG